jgi:HEAT repeat protein
MVGFAHLAERFGVLDAARVRPILEAGLRDREQYVREQAAAAVEALDQTLGW